MKLIVGLGNPGSDYAESRHNIGFLVVRELAKRSGAVLKKERGVTCLSVKARLSGQIVLLAMPLTYMNLSGIAVASLLKKYKINLEGLLVACDDLDLEFGRPRLRPSGSSGGHRGLQSIMGSLRSKEFARLRIGIGRPAKIIPPAEYVLLPFKKMEKVQLRQILETAADCCESWVTAGVAGTMNIFNKFNKRGKDNA